MLLRALFQIAVALIAIGTVIYGLVLAYHGNYSQACFELLLAGIIIRLG